ncbi:DNA primase [Candidatus Woesearchaeota archaeon]|nr:DNA primase [Candidatus Woesearchaeota archaeon]
MGKISPVSSKYIIHATIQISGIVDKPDVIGAIFGQTEGLLGADLELRELQRSGRIGRIEVNVETKTGKTKGDIIIPSSLDKSETAIVGAALEIIQRIGPCVAKLKVENIEDVRISKRQAVVDRAKELLRTMMDDQMPDSQELADEVAQSVRVMEIQEYGKGRLPAGPHIEDSDEIVVVEGRADVLNLLKHGFKNSIGIGGTGIPPEIAELCKQKIVTLFVDGDRGGDLIIKEMTGIAEVDYITKAPDGKEVEELTKKEVHKALRSRIASEQAKLDMVPKAENGQRPTSRAPPRREAPQMQRRPRTDIPPRRTPVSSRPPTRITSVRKLRVSDAEKESYKNMLEGLVGTRGAYVLDGKLNILGKVPVSELQTTVKSLDSGIHAIIFDGAVDKALVEVCEKARVKCLVGMSTEVKPTDARINILTSNEL